MTDLVTHKQDSLADIAALIAAPLTGLFQRRQAYSGLMALDDRLLEDIGLNRGDVPRAVYGGEDTSLIGQLIAAVKKANEKRATLRALEALPDHLLADIGFERHMIEAQVDGELPRDRAGFVSLGLGIPGQTVAAQIARIDAGMGTAVDNGAEAAAETPAKHKIAA